jgi:hypothetical protein
VTASPIFITNTSGYVRRMGHESILSAITHKLNVSGLRLVWTVFLVLACGTRAQFFPLLSVKPCIVRSLQLIYQILYRSVMAAVQGPDVAHPSCIHTQSFDTLHRRFLRLQYTSTRRFSDLAPFVLWTCNQNVWDNTLVGSFLFYLKTLLSIIF